MKFAPILALVLAACAGGGLVERPDEAPAADLAGRFEQHAFYEEDTDREVPLARFEQDVRFHFVFDDRERFTEFMPDLSAVIDDMIDLTALRMDVDPERPNLYVLMRDRAGNIESATFDQRRFPDAIDSGFVELARRATCGVQLFLDERWQIRTAVVFLPIDLDDDHLRRCIVQEIAQAFGLPNDVADPDGTVFSSTNRRTTLSEMDRKLIRILYDDRLRSGMTRAEAMPIVRRIIAERGW